MKSSEYSSRAGVQSPECPPSSSPSPLIIPRRGVTPSGGGWLVLSLYGSEAAWRAGRVVLFCHGFTGNRIESRRLFVRQARMLAEAGLAAVTFDYRGNGESSGDFQDMCVSTLREDAAAAIEFVRQQVAPAPLTLGLLGYSMGGMVASLAAGRRPKGLEAIALWAGVSCYPEILNRILGCPIPEALEKFDFPFLRDGWPVGRKFFEEVQDTCPSESLAAAGKPVVIFHAEDDTAVGPQNARDFEQVLAATGVPHEVNFFPEGGHSFGGPEQHAKLLTLTRDFFVKHLLQKP